MSEGILRVDYPVGRYHRFVIYDPKERVIHAARFSERVLHHALMTVCEPLFERWLIDDTYACRRGKGHCHTERRKARWFGNPKGIVSSRPGLPSPRGYPGLTPVRFSTPPGLCPRSAIEPQSLGLADTTPLFPG